jgi:hypothetical protein
MAKAKKAGGPRCKRRAADLQCDPYIRTAGQPLARTGPSASAADPGSRPPIACFLGFARTAASLCLGWTSLTDLSGRFRRA